MGSLASLDLKFAMVDLADKPAGWFAGFASTADEDRGKDIVAPNAFAKSIAERGLKGPRCVKMLWQHDSERPCGSWLKMEQQDPGLYCEGLYNLETKVGGEGYKHTKAGEVLNLSVGFRTIRKEINEDTWVRTILEADLWEVSPVTFPMNEGAQIIAVKAAPFVLDAGDDIAAIAKKFAASYELSRRQADAALDALKAAMRVDPELKALKAALGVASAELSKPTVKSDYTPAIDAFSKVLNTLRASR